MSRNTRRGHAVGATKNPNPLRLSKRDALRLTGNRTLLQSPPAGVPLPDIAAMGAEGIPGDVLFLLENLRQLADQGNLVARQLYERERRRWGIGDRTTIGP